VVPRGGALPRPGSFRRGVPPAWGFYKGAEPICVLLSESTQATTSRAIHENLLGNCFTNAAVNVSAMT